MPSRRLRRPPVVRRGVTLLELIVVLLLVGLATALVTPALTHTNPPDDADAPMTRVVEAGRATAIRRGETLVLDVAADGRWSLVVAHADSMALARGALDVVPVTPVRLLLSPIGLCLPDDAGSEAEPTWDAATCRSLDAVAATSR